jgi:uncharacterized membrane protein
MSDSQSHDRHDARGLTRSLVLVVAGLVIALGVAAAVVPNIVNATGRDLVSPAGLYAAAAFRGGIGLVLLLAARESRAPGILRAIGIAVLAIGLATPLLGVDRAMARLDWEAEHITFLRIEGVLFVWAGFIISALARRPQHRLSGVDGQS